MWILIAAILGFLLTALHLLFPKKYQSFREMRLFSKIPGLPTVPYFGSAFSLMMNNEEFLPFLIDLYDKYKPIFKMDVLGHVDIFLSDIDDIAVLFNSRQHIEKSADYFFLLPWLGAGLLTSSGHKWFHRRKLLTPTFHFQILEQYIDVLNRNGRILVDQLNHRSDKDFVEINPLTILCTLDIICETAMGTSVNAQSGGEKEYVKATLRMSQIFQRRLITPWMWKPILFNLQPLGWEHRKTLKILHGFAEKVIQERKEYFKENKNIKNGLTNHPTDEFGVKKKLSFLDLLIQIQETEHEMTDADIREEVDTFMFEGHDTTAAALSWALFELGHHPQIQEKAFQEQWEIFGDSERPVTSADLHKMKYLERVMKEALRLYPSVPVISRILETDVTIKGYLIPAGTCVPAFIYYIHRDPKLYPDPLKFDPDRFLPENTQNRHPYAYIPFSAGSRNCIGQKFAEMEEKTLLSYIIRNFQFKSLDKREDVKMMGELILRPKDNLRMVFTPRKMSKSG